MTSALQGTPCYCYCYCYPLLVAAVVPWTGRAGSWYDCKSSTAVVVVVVVGADAGGTVDGMAVVVVSGSGDGDDERRDAAAAVVGGEVCVEMLATGDAYDGQTNHQSPHAEKGHSCSVGEMLDPPVAFLDTTAGMDTTVRGLMNREHSFQAQSGTSSVGSLAYSAAAAAASGEAASWLELWHYWHCLDHQSSNVQQQLHWIPSGKLQYLACLLLLLQLVVTSVVAAAVAAGH